MHHSGGDLGRRGKRLWWQVQHDTRIGPPLCKQRQTAIGLGAGLGHDPLGHFALEHQRQALPERWPFLRGQPTHQQLCPHVIGQVRRDTDRWGQMGQRVDFKGVAFDHRQTVGIGLGDLGQSGQAAFVFLDRQHAARAFGQ